MSSNENVDLFLSHDEQVRAEAAKCAARIFQGKLTLQRGLLESEAGNEDSWNDDDLKEIVGASNAVLLLACAIASYIEFGTNIICNKYTMQNPPLEEMD